MWFTIPKPLLNACERVQAVLQINADINEWLNGHFYLPENLSARHFTCMLTNNSAVSHTFLRILTVLYTKPALRALCPLQLITQAMPALHCATINSADHIAPLGSISVHLFIAIF